jgi:hypothetical protein
MSIMYNIESLVNVLESVGKENSIVSDFLEKTTWESILNERNKNNGILLKTINENKNKSIITGILNKLSDINFKNCVDEVFSLKFINVDDFMEIIYIIIDKLVNTKIVSTKKILSSLCFEIRDLHLNFNDRVFYFENILLDEIKKNYDSLLIDYDKDKSENILSTISNLYSIELINLDIIQSIFKDLKKIIEFNETKTNFENVENSISMMCFFIDNIKLDDHYKFVVADIHNFLKEQQKLYGKNISMKIKVKILNTIDKK